MGLECTALFNNNGGGFEGLQVVVFQNIIVLF